MIVAMFILAILSTLMMAAILVIAAITLSTVRRFRAECSDAAADHRKRFARFVAQFADHRKQLRTQVRCLLEVQLANNKFLAGQGLPPTPEALERQLLYRQEVAEAAEVAGIDPADLAEAMREEEEADAR